MNAWSQFLISTLKYNVQMWSSSVCQLCYWQVQKMTQANMKPEWQNTTSAFLDDVFFCLGTLYLSGSETETLFVTHIHLLYRSTEKFPWLYYMWVSNCTNNIVPLSIKIPVIVMHVIPIYKSYPQPSQKVWSTLNCPLSITCLELQMSAPWFLEGG